MSLVHHNTGDGGHLADHNAIADYLAGPAFVSAASSATLSSIQLAAAESTTVDGPLNPTAAWFHVGFSNSMTLDVTNFTQGAKSVQSGVRIDKADDKGFRMSYRFGVQLGAAYTIPAGIQAVQFDVRFQRGGAAYQYATREIFEAVVSDGVFNGIEYTGNVVAYPLSVEPGLRVNDSYEYPLTRFDTVTVPLDGLSTVRCIGLRQRGFTLATASQTVLINIDNVRLKAATELENAAASSDAVVVPPTYTPSGTQETALYAVSPHAGGAAVLDLRPGYQLLYNDGGVRHVREIQKLGLETGTEDASVELSNIIGSLRPGSKLVFPPGGTYLINEAMVQMAGLRDVEIDFNGARFFRDTADLDWALFAVDACERTKLHGFKLFGYDSTERLGSDLVDVVGSTVNGTTRLLDAQNDACKSPTARWYGTDKDGDTVCTVVLSDTAQVANDCRVSLIYDVGGAVLGARDLTLTATPTTYTIRLPKIRYGYESLRWQISKQTATANTITVTSMQELYTPGPVAGGAPHENQIGVNLRGSNNDVDIYDFHGEAMQSYLVQITGGAYAKRIRVHDFTGHAIGVQGLAVIKCDGPVYFEDFELSLVNGNGFDIEPNVDSEYAKNVFINHAVFRGGKLAGFASTGWWKNYNVHVRDAVVDGFQSIAEYGWGCQERGTFWDIKGYNLTNPERNSAINGQDMYVSRHIGAGVTLGTTSVFKDLGDGQGVREITQFGNISENVHATWGA